MSAKGIAMLFFAALFVGCSAPQAPHIGETRAAIEGRGWTLEPDNAERHRNWVRYDAHAYPFALTGPKFYWLTFENDTLAQISIRRF